MAIQDYTEQFIKDSGITEPKEIEWMRTDPAYRVFATEIFFPGHYKICDVCTALLPMGMFTDFAGEPTPGYRCLHQPINLVEG
jgi:hypothetical protein